MIYYPSDNGLFLYYNSKGITNYVNVKVSSCDPERDPYTPLDENSKENSFVTDQTQNTNQWYYIELKEDYFSLSSYRIKSPSHYANEWGLLKSWQIYGSRNNIDWILLDEQNTDKLNAPYSQETFPCKNNNNYFYKYFVLYQNDVGCDGNYGFGLNRLEFFGSTIKLEDIQSLFRITFKQNIISFSSLLFIIITFSK